MIEFGINSPLRKGPGPPRTKQGLLVSSQSAKSVETDSLTSSLITDSTPKLGTMERMAMLKLKNSTNRMSHIDLQKRRNTDKRKYIQISKKAKKKKTNYYGLTSEQSSKLEQTKNRLLSKAPMTQYQMLRESLNTPDFSRDSRSVNKLISTKKHVMNSE